MNRELVRRDENWVFEDLVFYHTPGLALNDGFGN